MNEDCNNTMETTGNKVPGIPGARWIECRLLAMQVGADAECIALITQVMGHYPTANGPAVVLGSIRQANP